MLFSLLSAMNVVNNTHNMNFNWKKRNIPLYKTLYMLPTRQRHAYQVSDNQNRPGVDRQVQGRHQFAVARRRVDVRADRDEEKDAIEVALRHRCVQEVAAFLVHLQAKYEPKNGAFLISNV